MLHGKYIIVLVELYLGNFSCVFPNVTKKALGT